MNVPKDKSEDKLNREIISSSHINFLFGAGVNGKGFPQISGFTKTNELLSRKVSNYKACNFENSINTLNKDEREEVCKQFKDEFFAFIKKIDYKNESLVNLRELFKTTYEVVESCENRQIDMKQVNIYTLNYDNIVNNILDKLGYINNEISASNLNTNIKLLDIVSYDYKLKKYIPNFMISKLHGDINNPILPGNNKYEDSLASEYFEINYRMKENLFKQNSVLFVIGYSCNDDDINKILIDCINNGLVVYWYKYKKDDKVLTHSNHKQLIVIEPDKKPCDTTLKCKNDLEEVCK